MLSSSYGSSGLSVTQALDWNVVGHGQSINIDANSGVYDSLTFSALSDSLSRTFLNTENGLPFIAVARILRYGFTGRFNEKYAPKNKEKPKRD